MASMELTLSKKAQEGLRTFMAKVYGWMGLALFITFGTALGTAVLASYSATLYHLLFPRGVVVLCVAEIIIAVAFSINIGKMTVSQAGWSFILYSFVTGITFASLFFVYKLDSLVSVFLITSLLFVAMSIYGANTKRNLLSFGRYLTMALFGLIIASVIIWLLSFFIHVDIMNYLISYAFVLVFTGLTAYDTWKMVRGAVYNDGSDFYQKAAIFCALNLYLDFINLFLRLLRIMGKRK